MSYRIWYSTESFANYIIDNTILSERSVIKTFLPESDASKPKSFFKVPDHLKKILYLDAPDIIVEFDNEPIFSIEESREAGTGHNSFQRFSRLAAAVENNVPSFYIYPEATIIKRKKSIRWDKINPLIFQALDNVMDIYDVPALLYYFPTDFISYRGNPQDSPNFLNNNKGTRHEDSLVYAGCPDINDSQMQEMFQHINFFITEIEQKGLQVLRKLIKERPIRNKRNWMRNEFIQKKGSLNSSPLTSTIELPTEFLINYLSKYNNTVYDVSKSELLTKRQTTLFYFTGSKYRPQGDPFTGCLAAIDYMRCRTGATFEDRDVNLIMVWGKLDVDYENKIFKIVGNKCSIDNFISQAEYGEKKSLLLKGYKKLKPQEIPRYYMQVRYGSTYSKSKPVRIFSYFADAILFNDGALWRDA